MPEWRNGKIYDIFVCVECRETRSVIDPLHCKEGPLHFCSDICRCIFLAKQTHSERVKLMMGVANVCVFPDEYSVTGKTGVRHG